MERLFARRTLRRAVLALAALTAVYHAWSIGELWRTVFPPAGAADPPFTVRGVPPGVYAARTEPVTAINGRAIRGISDYSRAFASSKSGEVWRATLGSGKTVDVTLKPRSEPEKAWLALFLQLVVATFCFALGFSVALQRPDDPRALILLGLMISMAAMFTSADVSAWPAPLRLLGVVWRHAMPATWPFWMILLGLWFPEKLNVSPWIHRVGWAAATPTLLFGVFGGVYQWAWFSDFELARRLSPILIAASGPIRILGMCGIGFFFACLGMGYGTARTPDAKRRAKLLNVGCHVSMLPMFAVVLWSIFTGRPMFLAAPEWLTIFAMLMIALFPVTLAYLVVVHKAMDVRVVLRLGLQYALMRGSHRLRERIDRRFFRESYRAEQILTELGDAVRTIVDRQQLLETVATKISESLRVSRVAVMLHSGNAFTPAYALGYDGEQPDAFDRDAPVARRLKRVNQPQTVYLEDPNSWAHRELADARELERLKQLQAQLLLPLSVRDDLIGFISLGAKQNEEPYSPTDLRLLRSVAAQAGFAIEHTRLTAAMAQEMARSQQLEREMAFAREVQQRLFPQRRPAVAGIAYAGACRPAQSVGGDYYDFMEAGGAFGFAVGDVSGKGMPAALLMAALQASVRGQAINGASDLAMFMANVNRLLYDMSMRSHFATLFYAQFDPSRRVLRFVNAGHNLPLLVRANGDVETLPTGGPGVGMTRLASYRESEIALASGDTLIAYTDGFSEAMNPALEEYGDERLQDAARRLAALDPEAMIAGFLREVDAFTAGEPQHDDMTMVTLKVQ